MPVKTKTVERATWYLVDQDPIELRPENGSRFREEEISKAVGGYVEMMAPAVKGTKVYVDEEGGLKHLPRNRHTWTFADRVTYVERNFYAPTWLVSGPALVVRKVRIDDPALATTPGLTITQFTSK